MFDQSAIQQLPRQRLLRLSKAVIAALAGKGVAAVHQDFKTQDLESYLLSDAAPQPVCYRLCG
jgi:hypothetical protein